MARYNTTIDSIHPPEVVFDAMADFSNTAIWDPNVESGERLDEGPLKVGSTFRLLNDFFGRKQRLTYEMIELDRPGRFVVKATPKAFDSIDTVTIVAKGSGSALTYDAVIDLKSRFAVALDPIMGLLFKVVAGKAGKGMAEYLNRPDLASDSAESG